jgi:hypothetical protein
VVLAVIASLRPAPTSQKETRGQRMQLEGNLERREDETESMIATGVSEARSHWHRGKTTPTLPTPKVARPGEDSFSVK